VDIYAVTRTYNWQNCALMS